MAKILQTPSVNSIVPFDPSLEYAVNFTYLDNQAEKNRMVVTDNETSIVVYDESQITKRLQHIIPAYTLIAGRKYLIQVQVFDADGNSSNLSAPVLFYCLSSPVFKFNNITDGMTYKNASITLELNYEQSEDEPIKNFQFFMYSSDKTLTESSSVFYSSSTLTHSFYGLQNNTVYYFRATGETNHGVTLDTGYVQVNVSFTTMSTNMLLKAENNYKEGYISLRFKVNVVDYELGNENYELQDGLLILKNNSLLYKEFNVDGDFSLILEAKELPIGKFITTDNDEISLSVINMFDIYYCKFTIKDSLFEQYIPILNAVVTSDGYIEVIDSRVGDDVIIGFIIKRLNGYYGVETYYKQKE